MEDGNRAFDITISSSAYLSESNGQDTGVICNLDYRYRIWIPVGLEEGRALRLRPLGVSAPSSPDDERIPLSREGALPP
jgi:hypothetical protein